MKPKNTRGLLAIAVLVAGGCAADSREDGATAEARAALDPNLVQLGKGYDPIQDVVAGECVVYDSVASLTGASGQKVTYSMELVESSKELSRKLDVSVGASASFGFGSVDAKTEYAEQHQLSQSSVYSVIKVSVLNTATGIKGARLAPDVAATLKANPARFRERCGDKFIAATQTGGVFYGILEIETSTDDEKHDLAVAISGGSLFVSAHGEVNEAFKQKLASKRVTVWSYQEGGNGDSAAPCTGPDLQCLLARAAAMPEDVKANPVAVNVSFDSYRHLALDGDSQMPIDTEQQHEVEAELVDAKNDAKDLLFQIRTVLKNPAEYVPFDASALAAAENLIAGNLNKLRLALSRCYHDYTKCLVPSDLAPVSATLPARKSAPGSNLVIDPGFEANATSAVSPPWSATLWPDEHVAAYAVERGIGTAHAGANDIRAWNKVGMLPSRFNLSQQLEVKPNTRYVLSAWIQSSRVMYSLQVNAMNPTSHESDNVGFLLGGLVPTFLGGSGAEDSLEYTHRTLEFDAGEHSSVTIDLGTSFKQPQSWIRIDDVSVTEKH